MNNETADIPVESVMAARGAAHMQRNRGESGRSWFPWTHRARPVDEPALEGDG